jgi:hypothetical protein
VTASAAAKTIADRTFPTCPPGERRSGRDGSTQAVDGGARRLTRWASAKCNCCTDLGCAKWPMILGTTSELRGLTCASSPTSGGTHPWRAGSGVARSWTNPVRQFAPAVSAIPGRASMKPSPAGPWPCAGSARRKAPRRGRGSGSPARCRIRPRAVSRWSTAVAGPRPEFDRPGARGDRFQLPAPVSPYGRA